MSGEIGSKGVPLSNYNPYETYYRQSEKRRVSDVRVVITSEQKNEVMKEVGERKVSAMISQMYADLQNIVNPHLRANIQSSVHGAGQFIAEIVDNQNIRTITMNDLVTLDDDIADMLITAMIRIRREQHKK